MSEIILDISANTHKNDWNYLQRMLDEVRKAEIAAGNTEKHKIIIKHQLFKEAGNNMPLDHQVFREAHYYASCLGYKTTSSVFDLESLKFLLEFDIPFVKIANRRDLDPLIGEVPRKIPVYVSYDQININNKADIKMACISKYPANIEDYESVFAKERHLKWGPDIWLTRAISDHTIGLDLFKKYQPRIWEKHYKLSDSTGLDAGPFAITPEELREIL
jgi:sialic acid synthase SpsE